MGAAVWQQILGQDAKYNAYRTPQDPHFKTQYLRRRSQLLREKAKNNTADSTSRLQYLKLRSKILSEKYGPISEMSSLRSSSVRGSVTTLDRLGIVPENKNATDPGTSLQANVIKAISARQTEANRSTGGNKSNAINYAFSGVFHVFESLPGSSATCIQFANDDKAKLAFASTDGLLRICELMPDAKVTVILKGHSAEITDFAWSISNDLIVTSSKDTTLRLWETTTGQCIRVLAEVRIAPIYCCAFHPLNNNFVVAGAGNGWVNVYNISTGKATKGGSGKISSTAVSLTFNSSGSLLWVGGGNGVLHSFIYDLASNKLRKGHQVTLSAGHPITCIQFRSWISLEAQDPSILVNVACNQLCLFRVTNNKGLVQLRKSFTIKQSTHRVRSVFCPLMSFRQGACVVTGNEDMTVSFFDIEKACKSSVKLFGHSAPVLDASFNYDESLLASCDTSGMVIVWRRDS